MAARAHTQLLAAPHHAEPHRTDDFRVHPAPEEIYRALTARSPPSKDRRPKAGFEACDRVRCIDARGLAQLQVGELYTIKQILPGGLLVFMEFSRVRAFHPSHFILAGPRLAHHR
jgi:hypothetical protein